MVEKSHLIRLLLHKIHLPLEGKAHKGGLTWSNRPFAMSDQICHPEIVDSIRGLHQYLRDLLPRTACRLRIFARIISLALRVVKRHESVRKRLSIVFPRVCIPCGILPGEEMVLIIGTTSVIIAYISPSGKHEPQRDRCHHR